MVVSITRDTRQPARVSVRLSANDYGVHIEGNAEGMRRVVSLVQEHYANSITHHDLIRIHFNIPMAPAEGTPDVYGFLRIMKNQNMLTEAERASFVRGIEQETKKALPKHAVRFVSLNDSNCPVDSITVESAGKYTLKLTIESQDQDLLAKLSKALGRGRYNADDQSLLVHYTHRQHMSLGDGFAEALKTEGITLDIESIDALDAAETDLLPDIPALATARSEEPSKLEKAKGWVGRTAEQVITRFNIGGTR